MGHSASVNLEKHCSVEDLRKVAEAKLETHLGVLVAQGESRAPRLASESQSFSFARWSSHAVSVESLCSAVSYQGIT